MGITFTIPGVTKAKVNQNFVCKECGASFGKPSYNQDCSICMGYGSDPDDDPFGDPSINVSGTSAAIIFYEILNYGHDEIQDVECGTLDPADVLIRLATSSSRLPGLVTPPSVEQGVYIDENGVGPGVKVVNPGYDWERLTSYVIRLRALAEQAVEAGKEIRFS